MDDLSPAVDEPLKFGRQRAYGALAAILRFVIVMRPEDCRAARKTLF